MKSDKFVRPLKELCEDYKNDIVDGPFGSDLQRNDYLPKGMPVLKIQNIKQFRIELKKMDYVSNAKYEALKRHSFCRGDIILTKLGNPLGASAVVEDIENGLIVADLVRIRANKINSKYLCYHLNSPITSVYINSLQNGTTRPRVRLEDVRNLPIYTPPLPEQQRIVALLDQAFAAIDTAQKNTERSINNARELFENCLNKTFSNPGKYWERKKIGDISKFEYGKPLSKDKRKANGLYPVYGANGVKARSDEFYYNRKSIIVGRKGSAGEINFTEECFWPLDVTYFVVIDEQKLDLNFFYFLLIFLDLPRLAKGVKPGINRNEIYGLEVFIPPLEEQKLIATKLEKLSSEIENLKMNYQKKLSALNKMKLSILEREISREL